MTPVCTIGVMGDTYSSSRAAHRVRAMMRRCDNMTRKMYAIYRYNLAVDRMRRATNSVDQEKARAWAKAWNMEAIQQLLAINVDVAKGDKCRR